MANAIGGGGGGMRNDGDSTGVDSAVSTDSPC